MLKKTILFFFGFALTSAIYSETKNLNIRYWQLDNGAKVYFVQRSEIPMLDIRVIFNAGSAQDGANFGLANLTNAMIGENTENQDADGIARAFENVGAQLSSNMNRDMACVSLRTLVNPEFLTPALHPFQALLRHANFPKTALKRAQQQAIAQVKSQEEDPWQLAANQFYQTIYTKQVYAHNPLGNIASIKLIQRDQLVKFYKKFYVAQNADIILIGDITALQAKNIAENLSKALPIGKPAPQLLIAMNLTAPTLKEIHYPSQQETILFGQVGMTRQNPDYFSLIIGNAVLGGLPLSSLLYSIVREKNGLAYVAMSSFEPLALRGPFLIALQTKISSAQTALTLSKNILKQFIQTGPTDSQLKAAKDNLIARFPLTLFTNRGMLTVLTNIAFYHQPLDYLDHYVNHINAVTTRSVHSAFQKNIDLNKMATITVGSK